MGYEEGEELMAKRPGVGNKNPYPRPNDRQNGCDEKKDDQKCTRSGYEHERHWSGSGETWTDKG